MGHSSYYWLRNKRDSRGRLFECVGGDSYATNTILSFDILPHRSTFTMSGLWGKYNQLLAAQPLATKAFTSLVGFSVGDVLAQKFIEPADKPYDIMRTIKLGSFGALLHGTTGHYFYGMLDSKLPGTKPVTVASKVFIDQVRVGIWRRGVVVGGGGVSFVIAIRFASRELFLTLLLFFLLFVFAFELISFSRSLAFI